jgi:hypothetical protein
MPPTVERRILSGACAWPAAQTDAVLVDIRKSSEVESKGSPALPKGQGGKLVRVEFDTIAGAPSRAPQIPSSIQPEPFRTD